MTNKYSLKNDDVSHEKRCQSKTLLTETELMWTTIDGNKTKSKPVAYCKSHKGYLTTKQLNVHRCLSRNCKSLDKLPHELWDKREERKKLRKLKRLSYSNNLSHMFR